MCRRPAMSRPVKGALGLRKDLDGELAQLGFVGPGVVAAEEQLTPGGEYRARLSSSPAAVTSVGESESGPG